MLQMKTPEIALTKQTKTNIDYALLRIVTILYLYMLRKLEVWSKCFRVNVQY